MNVTTPTYSASIDAKAYNNRTGSVFRLSVIGATSGNVWGSDIYTSDSNVAKAAVHAGIVAVGESKVVYVKMLGKQTSYASTTRNGITTTAYGEYANSFSFVNEDEINKPYENVIALPAEYTIGNLYTFNIKGANTGSVWGSDIYTADSNIAKSAVHKGIVSIGQTKSVTIRVLDGQSSYEGTTRNGITTTAYTAYSKSYEFVE